MRRSVVEALDGRSLVGATAGGIRLMAGVPAVGSDAEAKPAFALPVGTVTFLLTDIEGSSLLWESDRDGTAAAVAAHYAILDEVIGQHGGVRPVEQGEGDSVVAAFARASDAVSAALDGQRRLQTETPLKVRMAIHTGEAQLRDEGNYFGNAVNRCARLRALGHGGQVLLSRAAHDLVLDRLPAGVTLADLGSHRLRDLGRPEHVFQLVHSDLPAEFLPLRGLDASPHNLPTQLTTFIGREPELEQVRGLLQSSRLVTLTGSGGCGKTRLALHAAAESVGDHADGVWWVELGSLTDASLVPAALAGVLGVRDEPGRPLAEALSDHLRAKDALVVLDNCEHVLASASDMAVALLSACPLLAVLATSREPLGIQGEVAWRVPSLRLPDEKEPPPVDSLQEYDAVRMFVERATSVRPNFALSPGNVEAVTQICRRLDGIPLAIELAAARIRVLGPDQIALALDDRFRLLTGGSRTVMPRQQTLRASVQWSHGLLTDAERIVFRRLSAFAGGFTLDAAESVASGDGIDAYEVLDLLTSLVDRSLVVADEFAGRARYRMLETMRQFAGERLLEAGEAPAVRDRHLARYLAFAEQAKPHLVTRDQIAWLEQIEQERDNLRAALEWAEGETLARLANALLFFWSMRGHFREGIRWLDQAFDGVTQPGPIEVEAMWGAAHLRAYGGLGRAGFVLSFEAESHARRLEDPRLIARTLNTRGFMSMWADPKAGRAIFEESVARARDANDLWCLCDSLHLMAWTWMLSGTPRVGRPFIDEAATITEETGNQGALAWELVAIGMEYVYHGEYEAGRAALERSVEIAGVLGDPWTYGWAVPHLAYINLMQGRYDDAFERLQRARDFARESGSRGTMAFIDNVTAHAHVMTANPTAARDIDEILLGSRRGRADAWGYGWLVSVLALAYCQLGEFEKARERANEAVECARRLDSPLGTAWTRWTLGTIAHAAGDVDEAENEFHLSLAAAASHFYPTWMIDSLEGVALVAGRRDEYALAARLGAAVDRARDRFGYVRPPMAKPGFADVIERARAALDDETFSTAWSEGEALPLEEAISYASRARGQRKRPTVGWESLTPTELEVVRHLVTGLTNPQIGERMFISRGTVKTHLAHIFAKVGVATRAQLAAGAVERGV